jgi:tRNA nucleotidyltransferase (CCA-adding enzyme)
MSRFIHIKPAISGRISSPISTEIALTDLENQICTLLDDCTRHLREEKGLITKCRIAGGWVRDKLLGSQSNDIDIALEDMMGVSFAEHFAAFASSQDLPVGSVTKIQSNPGQSKHLETGRTTLLGVELDFVNLRSEEYAEDSRIPTGIAFGTPLQDALRRDITMNALFFNVHSRAVEDLTKRGINDLYEGVIRTPLPPKETFLDDPLRVLRCVRFASRFAFDMVPELKEAALDPAIQEALSAKISRERIGEELDKMVKGREPLRSIQLINELGLYPYIFTIPPAIASSFSSTPAAPITSVAAATVLHELLNPTLSPTSLPHIHDTLLSFALSSPGIIPRLYVAAALTPYAGVKCLDSKKKSHLAVEAAIREGLKLGTKNHYLDGIPALFTAAEVLKDRIRKLLKPNLASERVAIGLLLREKCVHNPNTGSHWKTSLLFSLLQELVPLYNVARDELDVQEASRIIQVYNTFVDRVEELELYKAVDLLPILNGVEVVEIIGSKPGPWTRQVLTRIIEWQLINPHGTTDECEEWLRAEKAAGRIRTDEKFGKRGKVSGDTSVAKRAKMVI